MAELPAPTQANLIAALRAFHELGVWPLSDWIPVLRAKGWVVLNPDLKLTHGGRDVLAAPAAKPVSAPVSKTSKWEPGSQNA